MAIRLANHLYRRDPETNRVTITRSWFVDTEDEIEAAPEASIMGYQWTGELNSRNREPDDITLGFQVDAIYEGIAPGKDKGIEKAVWKFQPRWEKEPIEKHPQLAWLISRYGGQEDPETGRVVFSRTLSNTPATGTSGLSPQGATATGTRPNPLYGLNESGWLSFHGMASARFLSTDASHLEGIGEIVEALPGNAPDFGIDEDRNWIKMPALVSEVPQPDGEDRLFEIDLQYMLSPKGGWPPAVYKFIEQ